MTARSLRILVGADAPRNPDSGAAGTVYATNQALRQLGHDVDEIWEDELPHRIRHWNLHYLLELPRGYRAAVQRRWARQEPDVVQLSQPHAWLAARDHRRQRRRGIFVNRSHGLESLADAALEAWAPKKANRGRLRTTASALLRRALHTHIDRVVRYADGLIVPSEEAREHLIAHHGAEPARVAVVHHGVPDVFIDTPRPELNEQRLKRLLNIGQFSPIKGPELLVEAVQQAMAADHDLSFTWVCAAEDHHKVHQLFHPEFRSRLRLEPWSGQETLVSLLDSHGVFVAHSVYEGAAKACTEAMARGLIVVSSAVGALKDHVRGDRTACLVPVGEVNEMSAEIRDLSSSLAKALEVSAAAVRWAGNHRWRDCAARSVHFYRALGAG